MPNALRRWRANGLSTGAASSATIKAPDDNTTDYVYVTYLAVQIVVVANGKTSTYGDNNSTPLNIAVINSLTLAAGVDQGGSFVYNFPRGFRLTLGKTFQVTDVATGCQTSFYAEGFQRKY